MKFTTSVLIPRIWIGFIFILSLVQIVRAEDLPYANPSSLGFSAKRLEHIDDYYRQAVKRGDMAGIVVLVARHGKIAHFSAIGYADTGTKRPMEKDTVFRLYSMTKPIAATALMMLYESGLFQLDDPVSKYIPEFSNLRVLRTPESADDDTVVAVREPTIHDLFRHTAGLVHGGAHYLKAGLFRLDISLEEMVKRMAKLPLRYQPGTKWNYSMGQDVQARLVEILSDMPFDQFLQQRLFGPLGMRDTGYFVQGSKVSRLSAVHWSKGGKLVPADDAHGFPEQNKDPLLEAANMSSYTTDNAHKGGSYGLLGTAEDYWRFAQMLLDGGQFGGHRFLSPSTVRYMARDHLGTVTISDAKGNPTGIGWGLGFAVVKDPVAEGINAPEGSYYWAGAANTTFWIDPKEDIVVVAMTQHMAAPSVSWPIIRGQLSAMVYGALVESSMNARGINSAASK